MAADDSRRNEEQPPEPEAVRNSEEFAETVGSVDMPTRSVHGSTQPAGQIVASLEAGETIGSFRVVTKLGEGGFGQVWEAIELPTGRRLALKILSVGLTSGEALERFRREGRLAASLNDPHCVYVFGAEEVGGYPAISMELMPGGTLTEKIKQEGRLETREAVGHALDILNGLEAAHRAGILHRDLKPSNCFLDADGRVRIGDFGLSRTLETDSDLTRTGSFMGTPYYASPEQIRGRDVDFQSDLYSLGATLYVMLTGRPPFEAEQAGELLARILSEGPAPFEKHGVDVPLGLQRVVYRLLSKDPAQRFPDHAALRAALLPYSGEALTAGGLFLRSGAVAADFVLLSLLFSPLGMKMMSVGMNLLQGIGLQLFSWFATFLYFALTESIGGRSPGKLLCGLRVTGTPFLITTWRQVAVRTIVFIAVVQVPASLYFLFLLSIGRFQYGDNTFAVISISMQIAGGLLLTTTMRRRNGFAGLHELASATRTTEARSREDVQFPVPVDRIQPTGLESSDRERFGPFRVVLRLWETDCGRLYLGRDEQLDRPVWVHENGGHARPVDRLVDVRPGRLRWLQGSREPGSCWDAFEAPSGCSLVEWVAERGTLSWSRTRELLIGLSEELAAGAEASDLPDNLAIDRIWVDTRGRPKWLEFATGPHRDDLLSRPIDRAEWREALRRVALFALEGTPARWESRTDRVCAPLPLHARETVDRVVRPEEFETPDDVADSLRALGRRAETVASWRRLATLIPAAMVGLMPFFGMAIFALTISVAPVAMRDVMLSDVYAKQLEKLEASEDDEPPAWLDADGIRMGLSASWTELNDNPSLGTLADAVKSETREMFESAQRDFPSPGPAELERAAAARQRFWDDGLVARLKIRDILTVTLVFLAFLGAISIVSSFVFRTNPSYMLAGVSIQTPDGSRAGRFRVLIRSLIGWSPALLLVLFLRLSPFDWESWVSIPVALLFLAGAIYEVWRPSCGLQDRIAGTRLQPR